MTRHFALLGKQISQNFSSRFIVSTQRKGPNHEIERLSNIDEISMAQKAVTKHGLHTN